MYRRKQITVNICTRRLPISRVETGLQPGEVQALFDSNPDFVRDSEGSEGSLCL